MPNLIHPGDPLACHSSDGNRFHHRIPLEIEYPVFIKKVGVILHIRRCRRIHCFLCMYAFRQCSLDPVQCHFHIIRTKIRFCDTKRMWKSGICLQITQDLLRILHKIRIYPESIRCLYCIHPCGSIRKCMLLLLQHQNVTGDFRPCHSLKCFYGKPHCSNQYRLFCQQFPE